MVSVSIASIRQGKSSNYGGPDPPQPALAACIKSTFGGRACGIYGFFTDFAFRVKKYLWGGVLLLDAGRVSKVSKDSQVAEGEKPTGTKMPCPQFTLRLPTPKDRNTTGEPRSLSFPNMNRHGIKRADSSSPSSSSASSAAADYYYLLLQILLFL